MARTLSEVQKVNLVSNSWAMSPVSVPSVHLRHASTQHYLQISFQDPDDSNVPCMVPSSQVPTQDLPYIPAPTILLPLALTFDGWSGSVWSHLAHIMGSRKIRSLFLRRRFLFSKTQLCSQHSLKLDDNQKMFALSTRESQCPHPLPNRLTDCNTPKKKLTANPSRLPMFPSTSDEGGTTKTKRYERIRSSSELNTTLYFWEKGKGSN